jgi:prepilin-type N-terminal cleavage/methylation domain-containing protein
MKSERNHQDGFTMIELLVATAMMVIICGAAVTMLISVMKTQPRDSERADQIGTARNAIEKLTADIRQGEKATLSGTSGVTLTTYCDGSAGTSKCQVTYACGTEPGVTPTRYACTRKVDNEPARPDLTGLASSEVFSGDGRSEPRYVGVKVQLPTPGEESVTVLEDGAALHNASAFRGT